MKLETWQTIRNELLQGVTKSINSEGRFKRVPSSHLEGFSMHMDVGSLRVAVLLGCTDTVLSQGARTANKNANVQNVPLQGALHNLANDRGHVRPSLQDVGRQARFVLATVVEAAVVGVPIEVGSTGAVEVLARNVLKQGGGAATPNHVDVFALTNKVGSHGSSGCHPYATNHEDDDPHWLKRTQTTTVWPRHVKGQRCSGTLLHNLVAQGLRPGLAGADLPWSCSTA